LLEGFMKVIHNRHLIDEVNEARRMEMVTLFRALKARPFLSIPTVHTAKGVHLATDGKLYNTGQQGAAHAHDSGLHGAQRAELPQPAPPRQETHIQASKRYFNEAVQALGLYATPSDIIKRFNELRDAEGVWSEVAVSLSSAACKKRRQRHVAQPKT